MKRRMLLIAVLVPVLGVALLVLRAELAARGCGRVHQDMRSR